MLTLTLAVQEDLKWEMNKGTAKLGREVNKSLRERYKRLYKERR